MGFNVVLDLFVEVFSLEFVLGGLDFVRARSRSSGAYRHVVGGRRNTAVLLCQLDVPRVTRAATQIDFVLFVGPFFDPDSLQPVGVAS